MRWRVLASTLLLSVCLGSLDSAQAQGPYSLRAVVGAPAPDQLVLSPDGGLLVSAGQDDLLRLYDARTLSLIRSFGHRGAAVERVALQGGTIYAGDADGVTVAWDLDGSPLYELPGNGRPIIALAADEDTLAVGALHGPLMLLDAHSGRPLARVDAPAEWMARAAFDLPRKRAVSTGEDGDLHLWDLERGLRVRVLKVGGVETTQLAFSPDGRLVAGGDWDGHVRVWEVETGALLHTLAGVGDTGGLSFSADSQRLYTRGADDTPVEWSLQGGERRGFPVVPQWTGLPPEEASEARERALNARADAALRADTLVTGWGSTLRSWQVDGAELRARHDTGLAAITEVAVSPDGSFVAAADTQGRIRVLRSSDGALMAQLLLPEGPAQGISWRPDNLAIAVAGPDRLVRVWVPLSGEPAEVLFGHEAPVQDLAWANSQRLWSGDSGGGVHQWDPATRQSLSSLEAPHPIETLEVSPTGQLLLWSPAGQVTRMGLDGTVMVVAASEGDFGAWGPGGGSWLNVQEQWMERLGASGSLQLSSGVAIVPTAVDWERGQVVAGTNAGSVVLLDPQDLSLQQSLRGQSQEVSSVSLSQDSSVLAAGSKDGTVRIWSH